MLVSLAVLVPTRSFAFSVTPSIIDSSALRGETGRGEFTLINTASEEKIFYFDTLNFTSSETGSPVFSTDSSKGNLATWMSLPSSLSVAANSQSQISFSIVIPDDIPSGSYQSAITISEYPSEVVSVNGATVEAIVALLVFLTVEGETTAQIGLLDVFADFADRFVSLPTGTISYRLQNQGNIFLIPTGALIIQDFFGRILYQQTLNEKGSRILPATTRTFTESVLAPQSWKEFLMMQTRFWSVGPMTAEVTLVAEGQTVSTTFLFWYFPWQLGTVVLSSLLVIWLIGHFLLSKKKS
ncbi:MAG: hypothetical protein UX57_C0003G0057 [Candidatus Uhrbacteria bacterium GW2011_GWE2_46_68]|uniref:DUF916 domain-containing protein n=2 Tax=Candidatus Uhriibacteriota TaxID=1752732 RepID=A0A0G1Q9R5_9BACT|nr:MAG: hypothetical protein UX45_C0022G0007 [Candidatus Uhrbacteria bacterium GW2011_GWF2_46_218]KKU41557.1 MAG: hypothetical protein UX57_C0003G0057 [Candidatus Uhrbacteria bacterium GW2011_GWE2_46_68]